MSDGEHKHKSNKRERESNTPSPEYTHTKRANMTGKSNDDLFRAITDMKASINNRMECMEKDLKETVNSMSAKLESKFAEWEEEKQQLLTHQKAMEKRLNELERRERRNNALITGLEATREDVKVVVNKAFAGLDQPVEVVEATVFKQQSGTCKIFVRFNNFEEKMAVFRQKKKLQTADGKGQVFINDDLTRREQEMQYHGRMFAKTMREQKKSVKMGYGKMCVEGEWWTWDDETKSYVNRKN